MPEAAEMTVGQRREVDGRAHRTEIEEVFMKFSRAYESGDLDPVRGLLLDEIRADFSTHGVLDGPEATIEGLSGSWAGADVVRHYSTNRYVATSSGTAQQSAYLTGLVADEKDGDLESSWFGGHYANTYRLTEEGWKLVELRFELDWQAGQHRSLQAWSPPRATLGWGLGAAPPRTVSGLDAPWHVIPSPEETGSDEDQVRDAFTRYTWAVDQWDLSLLADIFTEDLATDIPPFGPLQGRRKFLSTLQLFRTGRVNLHHVMGKTKVTVSGDQASLQVYRLLPYGVTSQTLDRNIYGATYDCSLRKEDGAWKFQRITYTEGTLFELA